MTQQSILTVIEDKIETPPFNQQQVKLLNAVNNSELKSVAKPIFNLTYNTLVGYRHMYLSRNGFVNLVRAIELIHSPNNFNHILSGGPFYRRILAKKEVFFEILFNNNNTIITRENAHEIRNVLFNETNLNNFVQYFNSILKPLVGHTRYIKKFEVFDSTAYNNMQHQHQRHKLVESELIYKLTQSGFELNEFTQKFSDQIDLSFHQPNFDFRVTVG